MALSKYQELGTVQDIKKMHENCEKLYAKVGTHKQLVDEGYKSLKTIKKLIETKNDYEKRLNQMSELLKQYTECGSVKEIQTLMKLSESTLDSVKAITKIRTTEEAKKLSEEFKCTVESASKLISKHGAEKAKQIIEEAFNKKQKENGLKIKADLLEEERKIPSTPAPEGPQKFLSKGMIAHSNSFGFNPEALGKVEEKLAINCSDNIKISFSSKYMMDALKSIESEDVELLFNGEIKPIILKNPESDNLIQLILPIRTY